MNEKLERSLSDLLEKTLNGVDTATQVVWQLLLWDGVTSFLKALLGLVMIIVFVIVVKKYTGPVEYGKKSLTHDGNDVGPQVIPLGFITFAYIPISLALLLNPTWLKILIAPKVWLLDYVRGLV